jgi:hypothetical protein
LIGENKTQISKKCSYDILENIHIKIYNQIDKYDEPCNYQNHLKATNYNQNNKYDRICNFYYQFENNKIKLVIIGSPSHPYIVVSGSRAMFSHPSLSLYYYSKRFSTSKIISIDVGNLSFNDLGGVCVIGCTNVCGALS